LPLCDQVLDLLEHCGFSFLVGVNSFLKTHSNQEIFL
jgi:hypothetical protein